MGLSPEIAAKTLPPWYKDFPRYTEDGASTWRNCVPFFDAMTSGFVFLTPCDINVAIVGGVASMTAVDQNFNDFVNARPQSSFDHAPAGYHKDHFAWYPRWGLTLPTGYSALFTTPFNRPDLPFLCLSGIIDSDGMTTPGMVPFFLQESFEGTIYTGTPFVQILPFKREDWSATAKSATPEVAMENLKKAMRYREDGKTDVYRETEWHNKKYRLSTE